MRPALAITMEPRDASTPADLERRVAFEAIRGRLFATDAQPVAIGRFLITSRVGQGGMGVVYSAYDPQLDRRVAVKVVRDLGRDAQEIERARRSLEREARAAAGLGHPNVVTIYDSGVTGDGFYVAMEFVEGTTLRQWLRLRTHGWMEILRMFVAAGHGLAAAHAASLVHCDFKPDNVLVGRDGRPRVADFGLVKHAGLRGEPSSEVDARASTLPSADTGTSIGGTPHYMAPEQHDGKGIGPHSDQFAFCVALYEALFGAHPYPSRRDPARPDVREGERSGAHERSRVPRAIVRATLQGLHRDPRLRHPSMQALLERLERGLRRRSALRWGLLGAVVTSLAAATGYALAGDPVDPCEGATAPITSAWNETTRADAHPRLAALAGPDEADDLVARLGAHADAWASMRQESCEATHHRGEQSAALLELRTACLDRNLHAFSGTLARLSGLGPAEGPAARRLVEALPPVTVCDAPTVRAHMTVRNAALGSSDRRRDAESDRAYVEIAQALDDARLEALVGRRIDAQLRAERAEQAARSAGLRYTEAEATLLRVSLQVERGHPETAEADLRRALGLAIAGDDPFTAAQIVVALLGLQRQGGPTLESRRMLVELGRAFAARTASATELRAAIELEDASDAHARGEHDAALAILDAALASLRAEGLGHASVASRLRTLRGQVLFSARRLAEAEVELSALLADQRTRLPAGHLDLGDTTFLLGEALRLAGEPARAHPLAEEARAIFVARLGPQADRTLSSLRTLGEIWQAEGQPRKAAEAFAAAIAGHQRAHGYFQAKQAIYLNQLAELELEAGEPVRAFADAHLAMAIGAKAFGRKSSTTTVLGITLGKAALARGQPALARTLLTAAHEGLRGAKDDPLWAAEAAWELARLAMLAQPPDRARAEELVDDASARLDAASGAHAEHLKAEIARFREHPPPD